MTNKYEAAEVLVIGPARDTILGVKDLDPEDNRPTPPFDRQDSPIGLFDE